MQDLKKLLEESSIVEQKAFLKSLVERIEVGDSEVKVIYTIPLLPDSSSTEAVGVLPFIQIRANTLRAENRLLNEHIKQQHPDKPLVSYGRVVIREEDGSEFIIADRYED